MQQVLQVQSFKHPVHTNKNNNNNANNNIYICSRNLDKSGNSSVVSGLGTPYPFGKEILSSSVQQNQATAASTKLTTTTVADG